MTVKQLIARLRQFEPNRLVVLSSDSEGNSFSPLSDLEAWAYKDGEIGLEKLTPEAKSQGYGSEDVLRGRKSVVLFP